MDELPGSDAFAELVRLAVAADPSLADSTAGRGASPPSAAADAKKPAWLRQRAPQGVSRYQISDAGRADVPELGCATQPTLTLLAVLVTITGAI